MASKKLQTQLVKQRFLQKVHLQNTKTALVDNYFQGLLENHLPIPQPNDLQLDLVARFPSLHAFQSIKDPLCSAR